MEWNEEENKFNKIPPKKPPTIEVGARLMEEVHYGFGVKCEGNGVMPIVAVTNTGCQTK